MEAGLRSRAEEELTGAVGAAPRTRSSQCQRVALRRPRGGRLPGRSRERDCVCSCFPAHSHATHARQGTHHTHPRCWHALQGRQAGADRARKEPRARHPTPGRLLAGLQTWLPSAAGCGLVWPQHNSTPKPARSPSKEVLGQKVPLMETHCMRHTLLGRRRDRACPAPSSPPLPPLCKR